MAVSRRLNLGFYGLNLPKITHNYPQMSIHNLQKAVNEFQALAPVVYPALFNSSRQDFDVNEASAYCAHFAYDLRPAMTVDQLWNVFGQYSTLRRRYDFYRTEATDFGREICAYSAMPTHEMFKINAVGESDSLVHSVDVTVYDSCDLFLTDLLDEPDALLAKGGSFRFRLGSDTILKSFFIPSSGQKSL